MLRELAKHLTTDPAVELRNHWSIPLMYIDFRTFPESEFQWGEAICSQRVLFPFHLHLFNVLSEIMLLSPFECFLVPLPHFGSHHISLEGGVGCQHLGLLTLELLNQFYLLSFRLLCESSIGGVQGLMVKRTRGHLLTQPGDISSLAIKRHNAL